MEYQSILYMFHQSNVNNMRKSSDGGILRGKLENTNNPTHSWSLLIRLMVFSVYYKNCNRHQIMYHQTNFTTQWVMIISALCTNFFIFYYLLAFYRWCLQYLKEILFHINHQNLICYRDVKSIIIHCTIYYIIICCKACSNIVIQ